MLNNDAGDTLCSECDQQFPGISEGLLLLRSYSAKHNNILDSRLLEDDVDCSADFALAIIEGVDKARTAQESGSEPTKSESQLAKSGTSSVLTGAEQTVLTKPAAHVNAYSSLSTSCGSYPKEAFVAEVDRTTFLGHACDHKVVESRCSTGISGELASTTTTLYEEGGVLATLG